MFFSTIRSFLPDCSSVNRRNSINVVPTKINFCRTIELNIFHKKKSSIAQQPLLLDFFSTAIIQADVWRKITSRQMLLWQKKSFLSTVPRELLPFSKLGNLQSILIVNIKI